jgi:hypothetical protein
MKSSRLKPSQHKCVLRGRVGLLLFPLLDKEFVGHSNSESAYYAFEIDGVIARGQRWEHQPVAVGDIGHVYVPWGMDVPVASFETLLSGQVIVNAGDCTRC